MLLALVSIKKTNMFCMFLWERKCNKDPFWTQSKGRSVFYNKISL